MYDFKAIEKKWDEKWEQNSCLKDMNLDEEKEKSYILYSLDRISDNFHTSKVKGTISADALARMKRLQGYNVLFSIGKNEGIDLEKKQNSTQDTAQLKKLGISFDYDKTASNSGNDKWREWIFLQLFRADKIYKENGTWYLRTKEYADKLLEGIDSIEMDEDIKELQRKWIGKTKGLNIKFTIYDESDNPVADITAFSEDILDIVNSPFLVLAPENSIIEKLSSHIKNINDIREYQEKTSHYTEFDRTVKIKIRTACKLEGLYTINPYTKSKIYLYTTSMLLNTSERGVEIGSRKAKSKYIELADKYSIPRVDTMFSAIQGSLGESLRGYLENQLRRKGIATDKTIYNRLILTDLSLDWIRSIDPTNSTKIASSDKLEYWKNVDYYICETKDIAINTLNALFLQNFLYDAGVVPTKEPFIKALGSEIVDRNHIGKENYKVSPLEVIDKYGKDAVRLQTQFVGKYSEYTPWEQNGIKEVSDFLNEVWDLQKNIDDLSNKQSRNIDDLTKKVTTDIENLKLADSITACMEFINQVKEEGFITREELKSFLILLNPMAPYITSEIYKIVFGENILDARWPKTSSKEKMLMKQI